MTWATFHEQEDDAFCGRSKIWSRQFNRARRFRSSRIGQYRRSRRRNESRPARVQKLSSVLCIWKEYIHTVASLNFNNPRLIFLRLRVCA
jgi:hypothetical protein